MKKFFLILVLLSSAVMYCQSYTEKYNSTYERYEYFNSYGELIGYKKWSALYDRWEYYQKKETKNSGKYKEYEKPVNFELANRALNSLQTRYDKNREKLFNHLKNLRMRGDNYFKNIDEKRAAQVKVYQLIKVIQDIDVNYRNTNDVNQLIIASSKMFDEIMYKIEMNE